MIGSMLESARCQQTNKMAKGKENRETFHIMSVLYCYLGVFYMVGGKTQYHEDPIEGGTTFRRVDMQKFRSIRGAQFDKDPGAYKIRYNILF